MILATGTVGKKLLELSEGMVFEGVQTKVTKLLTAKVTENLSKREGDVARRKVYTRYRCK